MRPHRAASTLRCHNVRSRPDKFDLQHWLADELLETDIGVTSKGIQDSGDLCSIGCEQFAVITEQNRRVRTRAGGHFTDSHFDQLLERDLLFRNLPDEFFNEFRQLFLRSCFCWRSRGCSVTYISLS